MVAECERFRKLLTRRVDSEQGVYESLVESRRALLMSPGRSSRKRKLPLWVAARQHARR